MIDHKKIRDFPTDKQIHEGSNVNFKVIVPSTRNRSIPISNLALQKRILKVNRFLTSLFGGSTEQSAIGNYTYNGEVIHENVVVISVFTTEDNYNMYDEKLRDFIRENKYIWGQDSMGFEYQGELFFI